MEEIRYLILAGGRGERLRPLTDRLPKPLVRFRSSGAIIDFTLRNCYRAQTGDVDVLTQYRGATIEAYISANWRSIFSAQGRYIGCINSNDWESGGFTGTADAVFKALLRRKILPEYIIVLSCDHVYRMNYEDLLSFHKKHGKTATVGCVQCPRNQADRFGIITSDFMSPIKSFHEKPESLEHIVAAAADPYASMGIYVFSVTRLLDYLGNNQSEPSHDFGKDIIPAMVSNSDIWAFPFVNEDGGCAYWRDVGDLASYWKANLEQISDSSWKIRLPVSTEVQEIPQFRDHYVKSQIYGRKTIINSKIADSVFIDEAHIENSIVCPGARIENGAVVKRSVVMDGAVIKGYSKVINMIVQPHEEIRGRHFGSRILPAVTTRLEMLA